MAYCPNCSSFLGAGEDTDPFCGNCDEPVMNCSDEDCGERGRTLKSKRLDYFGLAEAGSSDLVLRVPVQRQHDGDPFD
jgi:hypothetical protein